MKKFLIFFIALIFFYSCGGSNGDNNSQDCLTQQELQNMNFDCTTEALERSCTKYACNVTFEASGNLDSLFLENIQTPNLAETCQIDDCNTYICESGDTWFLDFVFLFELINGNIQSSLRGDIGSVVCTPVLTGQETIPFPILEPPVPFPVCTDDPESDFPDCPAEGINMLCPKPTTPPINLKSSCTYINTETEEVILGEIVPAECEVIDCFTLNCEFQFIEQLELITVSATLTTNFDSEGLFEGAAIIDGESGFEGTCGIGF